MTISLAWRGEEEEEKEARRGERVEVLDLGFWMVRAEFIFFIFSNSQFVLV